MYFERSFIYVNFPNELIFTSILVRNSLSSIWKHIHVYMSAPSDLHFCPVLNGTPRAYTTVHSTHLKTTEDRELCVCMCLYGEGALHGISHEAESKLISDEFSIPLSKTNGSTSHLLEAFYHSPFWLDDQQRSIVDRWRESS